MLYVLVRRETGDERSADRAAWLFSPGPAAFVLVMGYAEATAAGLRRRRLPGRPRRPGRPAVVAGRAPASARPPD